MSGLGSEKAIAKSGLHVGVGKYNRNLFKVITIGIDVHRKLWELKSSAAESFSDVIRKLVKAAKDRDLSFSFVRPVESGVQEFYRSGLF